MRRTSARLAARETPMTTAVPVKRRRVTPPPSATSSEDEEHSDASQDEDEPAEAVPIIMDEAGLVGPGVQMPSPAVWRILTHAVRVDKARSVAALIDALGGPMRGAAEDSVLSELSLECYLAILLPPPAEVAIGDRVRVLCRDTPAPVWLTGTITMAGAGIVMAAVQGVASPMRFDRVDWCYVSTHDAAPRVAPPAPARRTTASRRISLTTPGADEYGRKQALELRRMSCRAEAVAAITKRIAYGAGLGNRLARRAVLAIHTCQTADEQLEDCSKYRNAAGWSKFDAPRCASSRSCRRGVDFPHVSSLLTHMFSYAQGWRARSPHSIWCIA